MSRFPPAIPARRWRWLFRLRTMANIERPAIAAIWPLTMRGESIVLDVGATIGADSQQLMDFALMGRGYGACAVRDRLPDDRPAECRRRGEIKGQEEVKEAGRCCAKPISTRSTISVSSRAMISAREPSMSWSPRRLRRQHCAQGRRRHCSPDRRISQGCDVAHLGRQIEATSSPSSADYVARGRWTRRRQCRFLTPERRGDQESRRRQCRRDRVGDRGRLRHGQEWPKSENRKRFAKVSCRRLLPTGRKRHMSDGDEYGDPFSEVR